METFQIVKDIVLFLIAILGAALGIYNAWRARDADRIRLEVSAGFFIEIGDKGITITIKNTGKREASIKDINFMESDGRTGGWSGPPISKGPDLPFLLNAGRIAEFRFSVDVEPKIAAAILGDASFVRVATESGEFFDSPKNSIKPLVDAFKK